MITPDGLQAAVKGNMLTAAGAVKPGGIQGEGVVGDIADQPDGKGKPGIVDHTRLRRGAQRQGVWLLSVE